VSIPLKDFRLGITESIDIWLDAEAVAFGTDKAAVAREILQEWAKRKAHAYKVATRRLHANGLQPELPGLDTEDAGVSRRGTRP
jgi:hypothetical protein